MAVEIMILVQKHFAAEQNGRAGRSKLVAIGTQLLGPQWFAVDVIAQQPKAAKERNHSLAIRGNAGRGGASFGVHLFELVNFDRLPPQNAAASVVEAQG